MQVFAHDTIANLKAIFRHAAVGLTITDLDGRFVDVNDAFTRTTGYTPEELRATDVISITHPDYRRSNEALLRRVISGEIPAGVIQKEYIKKNGNLIWVQNSVSLLRSDDGKPAYLVAICEDITERKVVQSALRESEERFRVQFKATPVPIYSWRRVGNDFVLVDYNDAADRTTNHGIVELLGRKASHLYVGNPEVFAAMKAAFSQQQTICTTGEFRLLSSGEVKFLDVSFVYVPRDLVMVHTEDITERISAERAKREAERKYREIFENANEGIFQSTPDGKFLTANPALARMLGFDSAEDLIRQWTDIAMQQFVHPGRREEMKRLLEQVPVVRGFEYEAYRKDGKRIWLSDSVRAVRDTNDTIQYYEGIAEDITERKQAEDDLRKQKEILQTIFDRVPVMIVFLDQKMGVQLINQAWENTMGWTRREVIEGNLDILELCCPDKEYRDEVLQFVSRGSGEWKNFRSRVKDGRSIDSSWAVVHVSDGTIIGIGTDITRQKRIERLNSATGLLSDRLSGARTPLESATIITDVASELFEWDSCSLHLYDAEADRVESILSINRIGSELSDVTPSRASHPPSPTERRVIEDGAKLINEPIEASGVNSWGNARSLIIVPIRYGEQVIGLLSIERNQRDAYDATSLSELCLLADHCGQALNRIRAEQSLYESEERFRQIAENIDDVIWMVDADLRKLLYINPAYERIWGLSVESIYKDVTSFSDAVHRDDIDRVNHMREQRAQGSYETFEYRILRSDKSVRWIRTRSFPIRNAEGKTYRVAGVIEDVTERKRAETALRDYSRRLIAAQENERKQIARELHDEIGQVLTAVRINLQSLSQVCEKESIAVEVKEDVRVIDEALRRVRDLSFELRPSLLDDLGLAAATRWYVDRYARRAGINAEVVIDFKSPESRLPRDVETACFRILQEALTNVARHAQAEHVLVSLKNVDDDLQLSVKDNGVGMVASQLPERKNTVTTLGLRGMEERALAVMGHLEVISRPHRGTEVRATFPA